MRLRERLHSETAGLNSKRDKARIVGSLVKNALRVKAGRARDAVSEKAGRAHAKVSQAARGAHDHMILARQRRNNTEAFSQSDLVTYGITLRVEVVAASDLRNQSFGSPDPYCMLTVGLIGRPWVAKVANNPQVNTPVALREPHPRWNSALLLPISDAMCENFADTELTVRVMNAHATHKDTVLGEARLPLGQEPSGERTLRLLGGGFASLSLRWSLSVTEDEENAREDGEVEKRQVIAQLQHERKWKDLMHIAPFDSAASFWSENSDRGSVTTEGLQTLASVLSTKDGVADTAESSVGLNELILQAPLGAVLSGEPGLVSVVLEILLEHIGNLTPLSRSRLAGALICKLRQNSNNVLEDLMQQFLHDLFILSSGHLLVELKRLVDTGGTGHNLLAACCAVSRDTLRCSMLDHFHIEAEKMQQKFTHILSDIDMTVWVGTFGSGGPKFPKGPVPGALSLFELLGGRITFLSARPPVWETRTRGALLNDIGIAEATLLQGNLQNLAKALYNSKKAHKGMGEQKEKVFNEFAALHPDARFVFFGDSGEGDVDFALAFVSKIAARECTHPAEERVESCPDRLAFIHDVVEAEGVIPKTSPEQREVLRARGIHVFDTYLGAATQLYLYGLLGLSDLHYAAQNLADEFANIPPDEFKSLEIFNARQNELNRDLTAVDVILDRERRSSSFDASQELGESGQSTPVQGLDASGYPAPVSFPVVVETAQSAPNGFSTSVSCETASGLKMSKPQRAARAPTLKSGDSSDSDDEPLIS